VEAHAGSLPLSAARGQPARGNATSPLLIGR
jgi:hypothetical protein